jgi:hypothetical protein
VAFPLAASFNSCAFTSATSAFSHAACASAPLLASQLVLRSSRSRLHRHHHRLRHHVDIWGNFWNSVTLSLLSVPYIHGT